MTAATTTELFTTHIMGTGPYEGMWAVLHHLPGRIGPLVGLMRTEEDARQIIALLTAAYQLTCPDKH